MGADALNVRAIYRAVHVMDSPKPYDTISLKVYYPASFGDTDIERNTGLIPCDSTKAPLPVVLLLPGINVPPEAYAWLAKDIASEGYVVVTYSWISEEMPGFISLTPGLDMTAFGPDSYGKGPSCPAIAPILHDMAALNESGLLEGLIDLDTVILGGHSAGGTVALMNANANWFESVKASFSYGAHTGASVALGWPEDTVLPLGGNIPVLLMGGTEDGVIAESSHRYGKGHADSAIHRIERSYDEGVSEGSGSAMVIFEGANHFTFAWPTDGTTGRPFIDWAETSDGELLRAVMSDCVCRFIKSAVSGDHDLKELSMLVDHELVAAFNSK